MSRLIDADALIEDIREHSASYFADDFAHEWVDQQPTIVPEPKLIPCSERLPEVGKWVLCQCRAGIFDVMWLSGEREWNNSCATYMSSFVIAWMPLPEVYREEGD